MVSIKRVSFSYPGRPQTLNDFSLDVADGECILLCGESGCGKTTVTKLINGLIPHFTAGTFTSGTVSAENLSVSESELYELALHIGSVFQNPKSQFFNLDATSELAFGLENQGSAPSYIHMRLRHTVSTLHLESLMKRNIFAMSGGEKQLLAFASVYMMHPSVFLLDEPTANLDNKTIELLRAQIALLKRQGHTIIIAEHRLWFLSDLIDRAVFIKQGHIQQIFSGASFFALPDTKRKAMGLRSLVQTELNLPTALPPGSTKGLSVENLACSFGKGKPIFEKLSFSAIPGEILAICGRNGIGKTTLIRCLCGFVRQYSGTILIDGQKTNRKKRQKQAYCVMQDVNHQLFSDSVSGECLLSNHGYTGQQIKQILEHFDLLPFEEIHPMALSGGQKQRLAITTAILSRKQLLIFDEPTSGLDYVHMIKVAKAIKELANKGSTVIVVTHDKEFIRHVCDRILVL